MKEFFFSFFLDAPIFFGAEAPPNAVVSEMGIQGGAPPEGKGNATEGGCFAIIYKYIYI